MRLKLLLLVPATLLLLTSPASATPTTPELQLISPTPVSTTAGHSVSSTLTLKNTTSKNVTVRLQNVLPSLDGASLTSSNPPKLDPAFIGSALPATLVVGPGSTQIPITIKASKTLTSGIHPYAFQVTDLSVAPSTPQLAYVAVAVGTFSTTPKASHTTSSLLADSLSGTVSVTNPDPTTLAFSAQVDLYKGNKLVHTKQLTPAGYLLLASSKSWQGTWHQPNAFYGSYHSKLVVSYQTDKGPITQTTDLGTARTLTPWVLVLPVLLLVAALLCANRKYHWLPRHQ